MKKIITLFTTTIMIFSLVGCSSSKVERDPVLSKDLTSVLEAIYEKADLSEDDRQALEYYATTKLDDSNVENYLGSLEIEFSEGICSSPMMSSVPYELILLRLDENADVNAAKELIKENANPKKWICVEAEEVIVESIDNTLLFIMADESKSNAIKDAFLDLSEAK